MCRHSAWLVRYATETTISSLILLLRGELSTPHLQTVCDDSKELDVVALQQGHHLLEAACHPDSCLAALLMQQEAVQSRDGIEQHRLDRGTATTECGDE